MKEYTSHGAVISNDGRYRYVLDRVWVPLDNIRRLVAFVGLNPSTADALEDDRTIRRCVGFAQSWGFDGLAMLNLYAFRATDPAEMFAAGDPVGPLCDTYIHSRFTDPRCRDVVVCWGAGGDQERGDRVIDIAAFAGCTVWHLGLTRGGYPRHPLYLPGNTQRIEIETRGRYFKGQQHDG